MPKFPKYISFAQKRIDARVKRIVRVDTVDGLTSTRTISGQLVPSVKMGLFDFYIHKDSSTDQDTNANRTRFRHFAPVQAAEAV